MDGGADNGAQACGFMLAEEPQTANTLPTGATACLAPECLLSHQLGPDTGNMAIPLEVSRRVPSLKGGCYRAPIPSPGSGGTETGRGVARVPQQLRPESPVSCLLT